MFCVICCRALQARVSRQVLSGMVNDEEEEEAEAAKPERVSLVDLKHRGKKKAVAPISRVGAALSSKHMSIFKMISHSRLKCHVGLCNVIKKNLFMIFYSILLVCSQVIHEAYS